MKLFSLTFSSLSGGLSSERVGEVSYIIIRNEKEAKNAVNKRYAENARTSRPFAINGSFRCANGYHHAYPRV